MPDVNMNAQKYSQEWRASRKITLEQHRETVAQVWRDLRKLPGFDRLLKGWNEGSKDTRLPRVLTRRYQNGIISEMERRVAAHDLDKLMALSPSISDEECESRWGMHRLGADHHPLSWLATHQQIHIASVLEHVIDHMAVNRREGLCAATLGLDSGWFTRKNWETLCHCDEGDDSDWRAYARGVQDIVQPLSRFVRRHYTVPSVIAALELRSIPNPHKE